MHNSRKKFEEDFIADRTREFKERLAKIEDVEYNALVLEVLAQAQSDLIDMGILILDALETALYCAADVKCSERR